MSMNLIISLLLFSLLLIILTTYFLRKGRIPEKYALLWYCFAIIIIIVSFFPGILSFFANMLGFKLMSNMVLIILIGILFMLAMALTIMIAGQKKKTILLIQELALLKSRIGKLEDEDR